MQWWCEGMDACYLSLSKGKVKNLKEKTQETIAREALIGYVDAHMEEEHEHHHQEEEE